MDISEIIIRFANELTASGWRFLFTLGGVVGVAWGMVTLLRYHREASIPGNYANVSIGKVAAQLIICSMFIHLSVVISAASHTFMANEVDYGPISYSTPATFGRFADTINAVFTIAKLFGGIFCFRGLMALKRSTLNGSGSHQSDDFVFSAIIQLCFGAFLVQIDKVVDAVGATLGLYW